MTKQRKGTAGCIGTSAPRKYKALEDTGAVYPNTIRLQRGRIHLNFWSDRRIPRTVCVRDEVSLSGNEWQKHPFVTGPETLCIFGINCLRRGHFKDPKGYRWALGIAALSSDDLSEDPSVVRLLRIKEQQVPIVAQWAHDTSGHLGRDVT